MRCKVPCTFLSESRRAATHDLALADKLSIEFRTVESKVDVEIDAVESALRSIHALEVLLEVLAAEIGGEGDNFLNACIITLAQLAFAGWPLACTYEDPWYTLGTHLRRRHTAHPRT